MSRRTRFHLPSAIYHVMLRGNNGQAIFFSNEDKCRMCLLIQEGIERFGHSIHSFCFMTNHIHLAIQVKDVNISRIMQNLAFRYSQYINKKYNRIGHLFQGRFKSIVVDGNQYLKELIRYIHLNPVRANLVYQPEKYPWSSHRAYLQLDEYTWLTSDSMLKKFGSESNEAINNFERYVLRGIGFVAPMDFKTGLTDGIYGDEKFISEFLNSVEGFQSKEIKLSEIVAKFCNRFNISRSALCAPGKSRFESHVRGLLAYFVREIDNLSIEELALFLGRDPSGLSKLANRIERKCSQFPTFAVEINELRKCIHSQDSPMSECQA